MKNLITLILCITLTTLTSQNTETIDYKQATLQNGVQSGSIDNLKDVANVNITYDFSNMVIAGKSVDEQGHISEASFITKKVATIEAEDKGKGESFKQGWENAKVTDYPKAFEKLFNQYALKDIKMSGKNNGTDAGYNLLVRTTKIEPGYAKGFVKVLPYIDVEFVFTDKLGKELIIIFFKALAPSSAGAPAFASFKSLSPSYEKAAKKLVEFIQDTRKGNK